MRSAHPRSSPTPQPLSAAQPCLRQQKSPQRGSVEPHRPKSATNGHSQHQARDGARANLAGLGARGPGAEGTYPPDYPSCARNPPRLPTLWPPTAFIMANWATCGRAERASKKARLPGECRVCETKSTRCVSCDHTDHTKSELTHRKYLLQYSMRSQTTSHRSNLPTMGQKSENRACPVFVYI